MSTKTMRLPPRRVSMPINHVNNNNSHKRKDRDGFELKPPLPKSPRPTSVQVGSPKPPVDSNHLLAGCFAYEFLTRGTLLGQMWDPARSQAQADGAKEEAARAGKAEPRRADAEGTYQRYVEIASLLKTSGAQFPGIVNPSDLARLLRM